MAKEKLNIPIAKTEFDDEDFQAQLKPLKSGWIVQGPHVKEFEDKWNSFSGANHSIATTSCTSSLHMSLIALDIKEEDEVIVPAFTWISSANVVEHVKAKVIFCDISLDTFNIDCEKIRDLITPKTKAIIPVHLFGLPADMDSILKVANEFNLAVIEDAACGFNARYKGQHVGTIGDTGCFSFHPRKAITTGEGGMITTNNEELAVKLRSLRDHGAAITDLQRHYGNKPYLLPDFPYAGYNYRMTDIQASIGSSQMNRATEIGQKRKDIASLYDDKLKELYWLNPTVYNNDFEHGYQSYVCLFMPEKITIENISQINLMRNKFMEYLHKDGISTRPGTHAVHMLDYYKNKYDIKSEDYINAYIADQCSISFPLYPTLSVEELDYIFDSISKYKL